MKSLEESIEAERAAHLETKFNSEIVQVRTAVLFCLVCPKPVPPNFSVSGYFGLVTVHENVVANVSYVNGIVSIVSCCSYV